MAASRRFSRTTCCVASLGGHLLSNALWLMVPPRVFWPVPVVGFVAESMRGIAALQTHTARIGIAFAYVGLGTIFYLPTLSLVIWMKRSPCRN